MDFPEIQKIHQLLAAKDDTSRFVGLVLLKTFLDNHTSDLQHDQVEALWNSISPRFLDRLIRTGSRPGSEQRKQSGHMLDVAVAVIYTFTRLLNNCAVNERFYARIPNLANAVLYSSKETTRRIIDLIYELVQQSYGETVGGATCLAQLDVDHWAPLIEVAPQHKTVFSIFHWTWTKGVAVGPADVMRAKIDSALQLFLSSFKGHDPIPLLDFIVLILDNLDPNLRPLSPEWLRPLTRLIHDMASSGKPAEGRRAYTHCAAALLFAYPELAASPLFSDDPGSPKPIAYLFVKLVLADILATLHVLIPGAYTEEYISLSRRIGAALDIITSFVGFLITAADDVDLQRTLTPDRILSLHQDLARAIGDIMEYLRDRWDLFLAGSRGIESKQQVSRTGIFEDPTIPASIRLVAIWLRDDDGEPLRIQAAGLIDLFTEFYKMNRTSTDIPELRLPILAALEGMLQTTAGQEALNNSELLSRCLYPDIFAILTIQDVDLSTVDYIRGAAIAHIFQLLVIIDKDLCSHPASINLLESFAKYDIKTVSSRENSTNHSRLDFQTEMLELAAAVLSVPASGIPLAIQQRTKNSLKGTALRAMENWRSVNDEKMVARVASLGLH